MALLRVRHPATPPRDVDLGPAKGLYHSDRWYRLVAIPFENIYRFVGGRMRGSLR